MADGLFYNDLRAPFMVSDLATVTLASTAKALYTISNFPNLGGGYFAFAGKRMKIRLFGKATTVLTPGNGSFNVYWGSGADANGTAIMTGAPVALSASQTNISWDAEFNIRCTAPGATGALEVTGIAHFGVTLIASTLQPILLPASAAAPVSVDLSPAVNNIISVQYLRSGSTAETMTVQDMEVIPMN